MNIKLIVALGFLLISIFIGWCCYDYGYTQARTQQIDNYESMIRELKVESDQALQRERESYKKQEQLEAKYLEKLEEVKHNEATLIDEYRANSLVLRDSLKAKQCPDVSITTDSTVGNHATTTGGLHDRDVEFLIRYAARADSVAEQLASAQALIKQDRELCNGQNEISNTNEKIVSQGTSGGAPQAGAKTSQGFISA
ncbi:lysis system i-spanin subunit Rz [Acinetobacter sp. YH01020]|uniref:lysis system i-spanin subunit Rz n=1 Tax=Acinetobacter sp. YH01020 TaxID=2601034 RepID=UPI0015D45789|nr:lysis system i-spanin subunit Rz [Acinetobacter sp. YH01020]